MTGSGASTPTIDVLLIEDMSQQRLPALTLAAVLQRAGWHVRLAHFGSDQDASAIIALAQREHPRLVICSILFASLVPEYLRLTTALRQAGVRAHIALTGPLPSFASAELLAACPALDSVLCGEAEISAVQLASALCRAAPVEGSFSPNINSRAKPSSLDDLPFPVRGDLPHYAGCGFVTVESSRGCYHACTFCLPCAFYRAVGAPYRLRSVPNLMDEIEALYHRGARLFLFDDEQFLPPRHAREERVAALNWELKRRGLWIAFTIKCRADDVDESLFRRLKEMGLLRVYIGVESGCQETLDLLGKDVTAQRNVEALAILDGLGIVADFRSLLFHPWSTLETLWADLAFLRCVLPDVPTCFSFHEVEIYPGTPLAERLRAEGKSAGDPWPLTYTIADPRVELLRRLNRCVFGQAEIQDMLTQPWFDFLLQRRFQPDRVELSRAHELKGIAVSVNDESLKVWQEMLAFAAEGDIYDAARVNERASAWAGHVRSIKAWAENRLRGWLGKNP